MCCTEPEEELLHRLKIEAHIVLDMDELCRPTALDFPKYIVVGGLGGNVKLPG